MKFALAAFAIIISGAIKCLGCCLVKLTLKKSLVLCLVLSNTALRLTQDINFLVLIVF